MQFARSCLKHRNNLPLLQSLISTFASRKISRKIPHKTSTLAIYSAIKQREKSRLNSRRALKKSKSREAQRQPERQKYLRCDGCNSTLQSEDNAKFGYINPKILSEALNSNAQLVEDSYGARVLGRDEVILGMVHEVERQLGVQIIDRTTGSMKSLNEVNVLLRLQQRIDAYEQEAQTIRRSSKIRKQIFCYRCFTLKYQNKLPDEYDVKEEVVNDIGRVMEKVFKKHQNGPVYYIYVVDVLDILGSFKEEVFVRLVKSRAPFCIVINKLDIVNQKYLRRDILSTDIRRRIQEFDNNNSLGLQQKIKILQVSSLSKDGVQKLKQHIEPYKRIQLVGFPNTGKTTLLNSLAKLNQPTSKVPGTTLHITEHHDDRRRLIYDMPGLHSPHNLCNLISKPNQRGLLTWNKFYSPPLLTHQAFFYGGRVEIQGVRIIIFGLGGACSSGNRWFINNHNEFWKGLPELNILRITRYEIDLQFYDGKAKDLEISGYGFIGFRLCEKNQTGKTSRRLTLFLPANVQFRLRDSLIQDSELLHLRSSQTKRHLLDRVHRLKHIRANAPKRVR